MKKFYLVMTLLMVSFFNIHQNVNAQDQPLLIGILDIQSVIGKHPLLADNLPVIQKSVKADLIDYNKFKVECQKQANELKQQYKLDSPEYETHMKAIQDQLLQREKGLQEKEIKIRTEIAKIQFKAFSDVKAIIEEVALQKGILAVFMYNKVQNNTVSAETQFIEEMKSNLVLWYRTECDITAAVTAAMAAKLGLPKTPEGQGALNGISSQLGAPAPQGQGVQQLMQIPNR